MSIQTIIAVVAAVGVATFAVFGVARFVVSMQRGGEQDQQMTAAYVANPNNQTTLVVRGWNRAELDKILSGFLPAYDLPVDSTVKIKEESADKFTITFPNDIQPKFLYFLVNYLQYPKEVDPKNRSIAVVARVVLTSAFGAPNDALVGKNAMIYVPANDTDYDLVYIRIEQGQAYKISFTDLVWQPVDKMRIPNSIVGL